MPSAEPFVWNGAPCDGPRALVDAMFAITTAEEAERFLDEYRAVNPAAIGYVLGYVEPPERRRAMYELFAASHPVFGGAV